MKRKDTKLLINRSIEELVGGDIDRVQ